MASLISQMRNEMQQQPQQQQLNESIERTRALMQQIKNASNPEQAITNLIQSNSYLSEILKSGTGFEAFARELARRKRKDINEIIKQLQGG